MTSAVRMVRVALAAVIVSVGCATVDSNKTDDPSAPGATDVGPDIVAVPIGGMVLEPVEVRAEHQNIMTAVWSFDGEVDGFVVHRSIGGGPAEVVAQTEPETQTVEFNFSPCDGVLRVSVVGTLKGAPVFQGASGPADYCDMAFVPGGPSWVGCDDAVDPLCYPEEKPIHPVQLSSFWIDRTEVSFARYDECVAAGTCRPSKLENTYGGVGEANPVVGVNWPMAVTYCAWRGKRLPTEAEWEKTARGNTRHVYPWGNAWEPTFANWDDKGKYDGYAGLAPVDAFADVPAPSGALNMTGNVWEWVSDFYDPAYFAESPFLDPQGPDSGDERLAKGGAWKYDFYETRLRVTHRNPSPESGSSNHVGFRCARR